MTMIKKKIFIVFLVILILSITTTTSVFAITSCSAYVNSQTTTSLRGENISFTVGIKGGTSVQGILIIPTYDRNAFELVSGAFMISNALMSDFSVSEGDAVIAFNSDMNIDGGVLTFTLKVKNTAAIGMQSISAKVIITDSNGVSTLSTSNTSVQILCRHSFTKEDTSYLKSEATCTSSAIYYKSCAVCGEKGTTTFQYGFPLGHTDIGTDKDGNAICGVCGETYKRYILGDVNASGVVDTNDAIHCLRYILFPTKFSVNQNIDFDKDGRQSTNDAVYLLRHVLFPSKYPLF
jgi:hypothetical protein